MRTSTQLLVPAFFSIVPVYIFISLGALVEPLGLATVVILGLSSITLLAIGVITKPVGADWALVGLWALGLLGAIGAAVMALVL